MIHKVDFYARLVPRISARFKIGYKKIKKFSTQ